MTNTQEDHDGEPQLSKDVRRAHWSDDGQIYFIDGYGYAIAEGPMSSMKDGRRRELQSICVGKEEEVLAQLQEESAREEGRVHDRGKRPPIRKGASRSFRGQYKYGARVER